MIMIIIMILVVFIIVFIGADGHDLAAGGVAGARQLGPQINQ